MFVEPGKLAWMFAVSVVCGVALELFWEALGLLGCAVRYRRGGVIVPGGEGAAALTVVFIKDLFYFTVAGAVVAVLIYWTNDGEPRYLAFAGVAAGFFVTHRTLGRLLRRINERLVIFVFGAVLIALYPARLALSLLIRGVSSVRTKYRRARMTAYTLRRIRALKIIEKNGAPDNRCG